MNFDYYYGIEAEQFSFYRVPRLLIKDERFKGLSSDAKLLYGLMLDRMSLSMKNSWIDDENRVYIIYTIDDIMEDLGCARATCVKVIKELENDNGIGLIEKKRRGLGKPDIIYVKNFATIPDKKLDETNEIPDEKPDETDANADKTTEVQNLNFKKFNNYTSRSSETELQEVQNLNFRKFNNYTSRSSEIELQEVQKLDSNYTNNSYTDLNQTDNIESISSIISSENMDEKEVQPTTGKLPAGNFVVAGKTDGIDTIDTMADILETIKKNIEYDYLAMECEKHYEKEYLDEIVNLIVETILVRKGKIRISGAEYPYELVKNRFLSLTSSHIEYVLKCLKNNTTKVRNIKAYLLTTLYNAPATMNSYYRAEVQHDLNPF